MKHTTEELRELQNKSLEEKIQISTARIIEWYERWDGKVYISFSGGKDSTVLLDLVRRIYPDVPAVFSDTGLEFPELRQFVMRFDNIEIIKPKYSFTEVLKKYGYPMISKNVSYALYYAHDENTQWQRLNGTLKDKNGNLSIFNCKKWKFLMDADFKCTHLCCDSMKKRPMHTYQKSSMRVPYIGTLVDESNQRKRRWMAKGCNAFEGDKSKSTPMAFWTEQDVLKYIQKYNLPYASVYGDLVEIDGKLKFTGCQRTGCVFCGFGCHLEKEPNRFQSLAITHPQLYDYCMRGGKYDENGKWIPDKGLGMAKVLDFINVKWWNDGDEVKRDEYRAKYKEKEREQYESN